MQQTITPFLWFEKGAEEAAEFYVSVFAAAFPKDRSEIGDVSRYTKESAEASGQPEGSAMVVEIYLRGQRFNIMNGGAPKDFDVRMTNAISFAVECPTQREIDILWDGLSEGGAPGMCGWLADRYKVAWQIIPASLPKLLGGDDKGASGRAMGALMQMTKLDIGKLERARSGK